MRQARREQYGSWQRRNLHPHYSVSILDETSNRQDYGLQSAINRAIAGVFQSSGETSIASNILNTSYRIQRWPFSRNCIPNIKNRKLIFVQFHYLIIQAQQLQVRILITADKSWIINKQNEHVPRIQREALGPAVIFCISFTSMLGCFVIRFTCKHRFYYPVLKIPFVTSMNNESFVKLLNFFWSKKSLICKRFLPRAV